GGMTFFENVGTATGPLFDPPVAGAFGLDHVDHDATPTLVDIDGDGDLDAFVGERYGWTYFFENTGSAGSPEFAAPLTNPLGLTFVSSGAAPAFVDIDRDGDLDGFIGEGDGATLFSPNTGTSASPAFGAFSVDALGLSRVLTSAAPAFV